MNTDSESPSPLQLLILAYYFPPSGGAGVQRILKWVKYLPQHGVRPTVVTPDFGAYPSLDESLLGEIPPEAGIERTRSLDPFGSYARLTRRSRREAVSERTDTLGTEATWVERVARWTRANVFIPDARAGWVPFAASRVRTLARRKSFDAVLTTGPPHSTHLAGLVARGTVPVWIADLRDPWTDIHYYDALPRTGVARSIDIRLERAVLRRATAVTTVSPSWADLLSRKSGVEVEVIRNGYDPEDFADLPPPRRRDRFVIAHVGSLFGGRYPAALIEAVRELRNEGRAGALELRMVGRIGEDVRRRLEASEVPVSITGYVPHAEAIREMRSAGLLLLTSEPHPAESGHIPGKLYEYLASGNPVISLGAPAGDAADLLVRTRAGETFERHDAVGIKGNILRHYGRWETGRPPDGADPSSIAEFSRERQAGELASLLTSSREEA